MLRYGYAIRTGGDPEISGALRTGMERGTRVPYPPFGVLLHGPDRPHLAENSPPDCFPGARCHCGGEALGPRAAQGLQNVAFRRHSPEELEAMIEEARVIYGGKRYTPRWATRLLAGYALICYGVSLLYHAQDSMMEGGRTDVW